MSSLFTVDGTRLISLHTIYKRPTRLEEIETQLAALPDEIALHLARRYQGGPEAQGHNELYQEAQQRFIALHAEKEALLNPQDQVM